MIKSKCWHQCIRFFFGSCNFRHVQQHSKLKGVHDHSTCAFGNTALINEILIHPFQEY